MKTRAGFLIAAFLLSVVSTFAHHAFNAEYDASKLTRWAGTVTKVEWTNPHARFYVDVKDEGGTVTSWNFELGSTVQLRRQGWSRDSLKPEDQITLLAVGVLDLRHGGEIGAVHLMFAKNRLCGFSGLGSDDRSSLSL
jgi:hypothetical protein